MTHIPRQRREERHKYVGSRNVLDAHQRVYILRVCVFCVTVCSRGRRRSHSRYCLRRVARGSLWLVAAELMPLHSFFGSFKFQVSPVRSSHLTPDIIARRNTKLGSTTSLGRGIIAEDTTPHGRGARRCDISAGASIYQRSKEALSRKSSNQLPSPLGQAGAIRSSTDLFSRPTYLIITESSHHYLSHGGYASHTIYSFGDGRSSSCG